MISHSEATTYCECQRKWHYAYVEHIKKSTPYMTFGEIAHKVLETREIPDEVLYPELKEFFNINSWSNYFNHIFNCLDEELKDFEIIDKECKIVYNDIVGVIDLVCKHKSTGKIYLFDYKFCSTQKTYCDIILNEQLYIYAYLYASKNWLDVEDVVVGYISIPYAELSPPKVLSNGKLSVNKTQATSYQLFVDAIIKQKLNISDYEDILEHLKSFKYIKIIHSTVSRDKVDSIIDNIKNIEKDMQKDYVLECWDNYKCSKCLYVVECKHIY